jgi:hypothetical protein
MHLENSTTQLSVNQHLFLLIGTRYGEELNSDAFQFAIEK